VLDPFRDPSGVEWLPVAAWASDGEEGATPAGYPWQLRTTLGLGVWGTGNDWDYLALTCHLVTGLEDRYEHTFDSWDRKGEVERWQPCELIVPVDYQVDSAARALGTDLDTADHFLLYRTLHSRLPTPLLFWFAEQSVTDPWRGKSVVTNLDVFRANWRIAAGAAGAHAARECAGEFRWPVPCFAFCDVTPDLRVTLANGALSVRKPSVARLLDYALTANLLPWTELLSEQGDGGLTLRDGATDRLRTAIRVSEDVSRRIGTHDGGHLSDKSSRLMLRARLMNLVAPAALWSRLGVWAGDVPEGEWRLPLPPGMEAGANDSATT
jgi:hypothetical protein